MSHGGRPIRIYIVCCSVLDFRLKSLFASDSGHVQIQGQDRKLRDERVNGTISQVVSTHYTIFTLLQHDYIAEKGSSYW